MSSIYHVSCSLSPSEFTIRIREIECIETKKSFRFHDGYSDRVINKDKLLVADTGIRNTISGSDIDSLSFYTYCKVDDIGEAKRLVFISVTEKFENIKRSISLLQLTSLRSSPNVVTVDKDFFNPRKLK